MSLLSTYHLEHVPRTHSIHVAFYRDVTNAPFLHQQLLDGNTDFEYAFLEASVILSPTHLLSAVFRAVNDAVNGRLRSRNVHSEIVFALSPNNNIAESFRRFGMGPATKDVLIVKVDATGRDVATVEHEIDSHLRSVVMGTPVKFDPAILEQVTDMPRIKKIYKLNTGPTTKSSGKARAAGGQGAQPATGSDDRVELETLILGCMALRGQLN